PACAAGRRRRFSRRSPSARRMPLVRAVTRGLAAAKRGPSDTFAGSSVDGQAQAWLSGHSEAGASPRKRGNSFSWTLLTLRKVMIGRRRVGGFGTVNASLLSAAFVLTVAPRLSRAEQFVLFDATFPYTWNDAITSTPSKSHYYVNEGNWLNKARP